MAPRPTDHPDDLVFVAPARCCTYHPGLGNYVVGRVLRAGGVGAERMRARIASGEGVEPHGVGPEPARKEAWRKASSGAFGRNPGFTCPFWVEGVAHACSIHAERESVCRTWFCKIERGERGGVAWTALKAVLSRIEHSLSEWCLEVVPREDDDWASFYVRCADRVDAMTPEELARMRSRGLLLLLEQLTARIAERDLDLPPVLEARVADWVPRGGALAMSSFSRLDREPVPMWIFQLLGRFDGKRPWRDVLPEVEELVGEPVTEELVRRLWSRGLVGTPTPVTGERVSGLVSVIPGD